MSNWHKVMKEGRHVKNVRGATLQLHIGLVLSFKKELKLHHYLGASYQSTL